MSFMSLTSVVDKTLVSSLEPLNVDSIGTGGLSKTVIASGNATAVTKTSYEVCYIIATDLLFYKFPPEAFYFFRVKLSSPATFANNRIEGVAEGLISRPSDQRELCRFVDSNPGPWVGILVRTCHAEGLMYTMSVVAMVRQPLSFDYPYHSVANTGVIVARSVIKFSLLLSMYDRHLVLIH
ncbi:hypothetical protein TNCV_2794521 [Trichonephila clavipes]|nr:hypothetical protein TNCV_2794521 [Trichonephila clavipes]